jgi:phage regulator Rha-like protein
VNSFVGPENGAPGFCGSAPDASGRRSVIADHYRLNFQPVDFIDSKGERRPMYRMTAKGLSELAMSFSGDDAREVRIRSLDAFEEVVASRAAREPLGEHYRALRAPRH